MRNLLRELLGVIVAGIILIPVLGIVNILNGMAGLSEHPLNIATFTVAILVSGMLSTLIVKNK